MPIYTTRYHTTISTTREIGQGGEGVVYDVAGQSGIVAKIYHPSHRTPEKELKLQAMLENAPQDDTRRMTPPHISIAWPIEILYEHGRFAGFLMPRISRSPDIFEIYNPQQRSRNHPAFDWRYLHRTARNLATAIHALHTRGYVLGDINQKNVLVTPNALVTLVDTDSFQVRDAQGTIHRCRVGVAEYTPPELQGKSLDSVDRTVHHDLFGLAAMIFQLLMEGYHPFTGAPQDPSVSILGEIYVHCIKNGIFPYRSNRSFNPPPGAPLFSTLHKDVQSLLLRCFVKGHRNPRSRPSAEQWIHALDRAESKLVQCRTDASHWFSKHVRKCPWCACEARKQLANQPGRSLPQAQWPVQSPMAGSAVARPIRNRIRRRGIWTPTPGKKWAIAVGVILPFLIAGWMIVEDTGVVTRWNQVHQSWDRHALTVKNVLLKYWGELTDAAMERSDWSAASGKPKPTPKPTVKPVAVPTVRPSSFPSHTADGVPQREPERWRESGKTVSGSHGTSKADRSMRKLPVKSPTEKDGSERDSGENVNQADKYGNTALHRAVYANEMDQVNEYLVRGARVDRLNAAGNTPLDLAVRKGHAEIARVLIRKGADVNQKSGHGLSPLCVAIVNAHREVVDLLIDHGADINQRVKDDQTALHWAVRFNDFRTVERLIANGADVNVQDRWGYSPLHEAASKCYVGIARRLLERGADPDARTIDRKTAYRLARKAKCSDVADMLKKWRKR